MFIDATADTVIRLGRELVCSSATHFVDVRVAAYGRDFVDTKKRIFDRFHCVLC